MANYIEGSLWPMKKIQCLNLWMGGKCMIQKNNKQGMTNCGSKSSHGLKNMGCTRCGVHAPNVKEGASLFCLQQFETILFQMGGTHYLGCGKVQVQLMIQMKSGLKQIGPHSFRCKQWGRWWMKVWMWSIFFMTCSHCQMMNMKVWGLQGWIQTTMA